MNVVVFGKGGREHALAAVLSRTANVVVTPGSDGVPNSTSTPVTELDADLFVVGPDAEIVAGMADELRAQNKVVFAPNSDGAQIEGSKAWMKQLLIDAGVPTAQYNVFDATQTDDAIAFLHTLAAPYVVKTDGLAAGKGVLVTDSIEAAIADVRGKLSGETFGASGTRVVIEEALIGPEISLFAICDGNKAVPLLVAQDHKRLRDNDEGPNTGGMGAYAPVPFASPELVAQVMETAIAPTIAELQRRGIDYRGVLYCGLMLTEQGPKVLEYNCRFGDPETQVVLPLIQSDFTQLLYEAATGNITHTPQFSNDVAITVILATDGYPENPKTGDVITGIDKAEQVEGVTIFHAGTKRNTDGEFVTAGGRVLNVTAVGRNIGEARSRAYEAASYISWPKMHMRTDIAAQAL